MENDDANSFRGLKPVEQSTPVQPQPDRLFCEWCNHGPMFSWEIRNYGGDRVCRDCHMTAIEVDDDCS